MRKAVAAWGVFALGFIITMHPMRIEANSLALDPASSFRQLAFELRTPEAISKFLWKHFRFESDQSQFGQSEYWQSPEEFLLRGKGDCEDFALFAQALLKRNGIQSFLFNIYGGTFAHTVCVFKEKGKYQAIDGSKVIRFNAKNLNDLAFKIYPFWKTAAIVTLSSFEPRGRVITDFHRK